MIPQRTPATRETIPPPERKQMIQQVKTSACETTYEIDGERIRLWIIVGGTPAISFNDHGFVQRFPSVEKWGCEHYGSHCYDHQMPGRENWNDGNIQGPTFDVLPNGKETLLLWFKANKPLHDLRVARYEQLKPYLRLRSKRYHDKDQATYFWLDVDVRPHYLGNVHFDSRCMSGRFTNDMREWNLVDQNWQTLTAILSQYCNFHSGWEVLTTPQFDEVLEAMKAVA
jgi:hypothetical protein